MFIFLRDILVLVLEGDGKDGFCCQASVCCQVLYGYCQSWYFPRLPSNHAWSSNCILRLNSKLNFLHVLDSLPLLFRLYDFGGSHLSTFNCPLDDLNNFRCISMFSNLPNLLFNSLNFLLFKTICWFRCTSTNLDHLAWSSSVTCRAIYQFHCMSVILDHQIGPFQLYS